MREIQAQIDWATANVQKSHQSNQAPNGFVLDPNSGYYYHPQSQVYYDPNSQLFYNCATKAYYRWDSSTNSYVPAETPTTTTSVEADANVTPTPTLDSTETADSSAPVSQPFPTASTAAQNQQPAIHQTSSAASTTANKSSSGCIKFSILGKKQCKDMDRWNKKKVELAAEESKVEDVKSMPIKIRAVSQPSMDPGRQGGIRPRLYVSYEKLTCLLCQRKFKDERHLSRHELGSELHKKNLGLDEYEQVQRLEKSAGALGIELQPKTGVPLPGKKKHPQHTKRPATAVPTPVPAAVAEPDPEPFSDLNVGTRLLQSMGWKHGEGLGKNGTGITENVTVVCLGFIRRLSAILVA